MGRGKVLSFLLRADESVVQRTLYLMNELKSPFERFQEIYGFDESQARGRPCDTLPKYGNIPETIASEARTEGYRKILQTLDSLSRHRKSLEEELKVLRQRRREHNRAAKPFTENHPSEKAISKDELKKQRARVTAIRDTDLAIDTCLMRLKYTVPQITALEKRALKMCRLSPEEAYLQACSEFYMLRQQEEVETRIGIEQARCFRRQLGPTVNEKELQKEQKILSQWKAKAERQQTLLVDARRGGQKNVSSSDKAAAVKDEENVEEELEKETILEESNSK
jgi:Mitochondrial ribosomal protein S25